MLRSSILPPDFGMAGSVSCRRLRPMCRLSLVAAGSCNRTLDRPVQVASRVDCFMFQSRQCCWNVPRLQLLGSVGCNRLSCIVCMPCRAVSCCTSVPHLLTMPQGPFIGRFMLTTTHLHVLSNHFARSPTAMESVCCQGFPPQHVCDVVSQPCAMCMDRCLRTGTK